MVISLKFPNLRKDFEFFVIKTIFSILKKLKKNRILNYSPHLTKERCMLLVLLLFIAFITLLSLLYVYTTKSPVIQKIMATSTSMHKHNEADEYNERDPDLSIFIVLEDLEKDKNPWLEVLGVHNKEDLIFTDKPFPIVGVLRTVPSTRRRKEKVHLYALMSLRDWKEITKKREKMEDNITTSKIRINKQKRTGKVESEEYYKETETILMEANEINEQLRSLENSIGSGDIIFYSGVCEGLNGKNQIGELNVASDVFHGRDGDNHNLISYGRQKRLLMYAREAINLSPIKKYAIPGFENKTELKIKPFLGEELKPEIERDFQYYKSFAYSARAITNGHWIYKRKSMSDNEKPALIVKTVTKSLGRTEEKKVKNRRYFGVRYSAAWIVHFMDQYGSMLFEE